MEQAEYNRKMAILNLTFGQRIKIAWSLTKGRMIPYFLLFSVAFFVFVIPYILIVSLVTEVSLFFLILFFPYSLLYLYFWVGVYSSGLKYIDNKEQRFQLSTIWEPFKLWEKNFPSFLAVSATYTAINFLMEIILLIPFAGIVLNLVLVLFLAIFGSSYWFYLADNTEKPTKDLLTTPAKLVFPSFVRWLAAVGATFLSFIPCFVFFILMFIPLIILDPSFVDPLLYDKYDLAYHETPDINLGLLAITLLFLLLTLITGCISFIFCLFVTAIAYKQSLIDREMNLLNSATQATANQQNPFNSGTPQAPPTPYSPQWPQGGQGGQPPQSSGAQGPQKPQVPPSSQGQGQPPNN